ncbi:MAG: DUF3467 domain-containing protein [Planctomycetota bacterium]
MAKDKEKDVKAKEGAKGPTPGAATPQTQPASAEQGGVAPEGFRINEEGAYTARADYFAGSLAITEALLAFGNVNRQKREIKIDAKIVVSVRDAKRILMTLQQLMNQYEDKYGVIRV